MDSTQASTIDQLRHAGLLTESSEAVLSFKGREWLRALEDIQSDEVAGYASGALDLVMATSGLLR